MRAITLEFAAFGPYKDRQWIDFRSLGEETIFLITGPTGAGKTTIFDAICYALYGKASGSDRDVDSFRSHFSSPDDSTFVSFTFFLKDSYYTVNRKPKQPKRKTRGEGYREEPAQAELYQIINGEKSLVYSKINDVNEMIQQMLGLDYEQFRKMIMIPQGEFRKLITENSKDREEILQKIFHTYFYQKITDELKAQEKDARYQLEQIDWKLDQALQKVDWVTISDDMDLSTVLLNINQQAEVDEKRKQQILIHQKEVDQILQQKQQAFWEAKQLMEKFQKMEQLQQQQQELNQEKQSMKDKMKQLELADKAKHIQLAEKQWNERSDETAKQVEQTKQQRKLVEQEVQKWQHLKQQKQRQEQHLEYKEQERQHVREQKQKLPDVKQYQTIQTELQQLNKQIHQAKVDLKKLQVNKQECQAIIQHIEKKTESTNDVTKHYYNLKQIVQELEANSKKAENLSKEFCTLQQLRENYQKIRAQYQHYNEEITNVKQQLKEMEAAQKSEQAVLIAQQLETGQPCPVCGSTHHPNIARDQEISIDVDDLQSRKQVLEDLELLQAEVSEQLIQAKGNEEAKRQVVEGLAHDLSVSPENINATIINEQIQSFQKQIEVRKQQEFEMKQQLEQLEIDQTERKKQLEERKKIEERIDQLDKKIQGYQKQKWTNETKLEQLKNTLPEEAFQSNNWEQEVLAKEEELEQWFKDWQALQNNIEQQNIVVTQAKATLHSQKNFLSDQIKQKEKAEKTFRVYLEEAGFQNVSDYQKAKLSEQARNELKHEIDRFHQLEIKVNEQLQFLNEDLHDKQTPNLESLQSEVDNEKQTLETMQETLQQINYVINKAQELTDIIKQLQQERKKEEMVFSDISALAQLANGNNHLKLSFERYVLAAFLDEILMQANIRLDQLTEHRYQLLRSDQLAKQGANSGLDLEVIDQYTGQKRSVKTLSGGEGFKTSLSLALGMADVVQVHAGGVQLDTLFIDEGFGTLDDISLEQAIDCLKDLQQSNRILGIISHVPQLKEEIYAQLQISASSKGSNATFTFQT